MRIISGSARGRRLAEFSASGIRPTPDRVREALFSMLISHFGNLRGLNVLELFAGTGAMSLEALSRGAASAVLVDSSPQAARLIDENITRCTMAERARFLPLTVDRALCAGRWPDPFDLILLDPPYNKDYVPKILEKIVSLKLLAQNGIISVETEHDETVAIPEGYSLLTTRRYGRSALHLITHPREV